MLLNKLDLFLGISKKPDKVLKCCDNIEIEENEEYSVCRGCGVIKSLNSLKEPNLLYRSEATNDVFTTMRTYTKFYGNYKKLKWIHYSHNPLEYKERKLYLDELKINKICNKYNIPEKYAFQVLHEFKRFYIDANITFGGKVKYCLFLYIFNQILIKNKLKKIDIFLFINDFKISYKTYNSLLNKIGIKYLKLYKGITEYYKKMIYKYSILKNKISLEYFVFHCNKAEIHLMPKYNSLHPKVILFVAMYNLLEIYNIPYRYQDFWILSSKKIYYEYMYRFDYGLTADRCNTLSR